MNGTIEVGDVITWKADVPQYGQVSRIDTEDSCYWCDKWYYDAALSEVADHNRGYLTPDTAILVSKGTKPPQSTQEFTFTLDDLAKACDTSGIGSQKFLELQRALVNSK